ncbi:MAG TPA: hypothetical protein VFD15_04170 [Clostridia bacterium]|nr:hypothetical protein [Clostridia bacterium]
MSWLKSYIHSWVTKKQTEKTIRNINKNNLAGRNITVYRPSEIEAFFDPREPVGNTVISGGNVENRARATVAACLCAFHNKIPVLILHETNNLLEHKINYTFQASNKMAIVNSNNPIYDPLWGLTQQEIAYMVMNCAPKGYEIKPSGRQYIEGIAEFINCKGAPVCSDMFIRCPHSTLLDRVDKASQQGSLPTSQAQRIRNLLMQGQSERASIEAFFSQFDYQGRYLIADRTNRDRSVNIKQITDSCGLLMLDIQSSTNTVLLNVIVDEIQDVLAEGKNLLLVLDNINLASNQMLERLMKAQTTRCLTVMSSLDVYAALGSNAPLFATITGMAQKCIIYNHQSGISCEKWSNVFGYYDKGIVSQNLGSSRNAQEHSYGTTHSINVSMGKEYRVKPQEIIAMSQNEVFVLDRQSGELAFTTVV